MELGEGGREGTAVFVVVRSVKRSRTLVSQLHKHTPAMQQANSKWVSACVFSTVTILGKRVHAVSPLAPRSYKVSLEINKIPITMNWTPICLWVWLVKPCGQTNWISHSCSLVSYLFHSLPKQKPRSAGTVPSGGLCTGRKPICHSLWLKGGVLHLVGGIGLNNSPEIGINC